MILSLETATNICSVSFLDAEGNIHEKRLERRGSHSEYLFLFIRELMAENNFQINDLDAVLVSNGPGSYTGLRIVASAVKGLLFAHNVDLYAANTLAGFAVGGIELLKRRLVPGDQFFENSIHAVINARRSHLYHQQFMFKDKLEAGTQSQILDLSDVEKMIKPGDIIVGTGIERLSESSRKETNQVGLKAITADSLIKLFSSDSREAFFIKTTAEKLESNYISSSQV
ncbi:MAG: tRNA (adenosine(37)-N6)-threonylcarbamoyltransferase complex dimerization subunit type 1 TsaB [Balneolaceae bacterium]